MDPPRSTRKGQGQGQRGKGRGPEARWYDRSMSTSSEGERLIDEAPASNWQFDYSPAPERVPVKIDPRYDLFIDGRFVPPASGRYFETINPATEEPLAEVAEAGDADVDAAVEAAKAALPRWSRLKPRERAKYLFRIARRIQEQARELAVLETMDGGKPIKESRDVDLPLVAQHFFYHAGWADKLGTPFPVASRARSASAARSSRGTSRS